MKTHTPLILGNWKQNPATLGEARKTFLAIRKGLSRLRLKPTVALAVPNVYLQELRRLSPSQKIDFAAQTVDTTPTGAHTGNVGLTMLTSVGATAVIVGHSERRAAGTTDTTVAEKVAVVLGGKQTAVVCVGEEKRDTHGHYFSVVEKQLLAALKQVKNTQLKNLVIAYEPVWAIGTGDTATAEDVHEMKLFIQKVLADRFSRAALKKIRIIYGGSVKAKNAAELLQVGQVDGFLPGGASLKPAEFIKIVKIAHDYAKHS